MFHVHLRTVVLFLLQNELGWGVALVGEEEQLLFPHLLGLVLGVESLVLFLIHDEGDADVMANLTWYCHGLLQMI